MCYSFHDEWVFLLSVLSRNLTVTQDFPFVTSFFPYCNTSLTNLQKLDAISKKDIENYSVLVYNWL